jgi:hypothetical protein
MAPAVADPQWCRTRRLRGQPPFQLNLRGEEFQGGNFIIRPQLFFFNSNDGCCWFLGSFVGVV